MSHRWLRALALSILVVSIAMPGLAADPPAPPKKVLVELYTSQGCNSCPPASDLVGRLDGLGYGPDKVVVLNFHVDYFNTPWADPYSDAAYSRRQLSYNDVQGRNDLYFTPLMMVDGRYPLLGSDRPKALAALGRARKEPAAVALDLARSVEGARKSLTVRVAARSADVAGRELLVGVAVTDDIVTTKVPSGENAGRTLVEHHVVRRFDHKFIRVNRTAAESLAFPLELPPGGDPAHLRIAVFVQDRRDGWVYQADSVPWASAKTPGPSASRARDLERTIARRRAHRARSAWSAALAAYDIQAASTFLQSPASDSTDLPASCPACGSPFTADNPPIIPAGLPRGMRITGPITVTC
jgi:hypothetical protein